jgi:site-specific recombinase XerD
MSVRKISERKFQIDYYPGGRKGKRERHFFIGTEAEALDLEKTLRRTAPRKEIVNATIRKLVPEFFESYKNDHQPTTVVAAGFAFKHLEPIFSPLPIGRITPALIEQYKGQRLTEGVKKRTVNKELSYLSALVNWAVDNNYANPLEFRLRKFPMKQTKAPIPHVPSAADLEAVLQEVRPEIRGLFLLMYDNGLRKTEAYTLTAKQVDLQGGIIRIVGKGGKEAVIPIITERLKRELAAQVKAHPTGYLWPSPWSTGGTGPYKDIADSIKNAAIRAGFDARIYPHLLRHSFGTHGMNAGMSQKAVQGMLRHTTMATTDIYTHIAAEFLKGEGAKLSSALEGHLTTSAKPKAKKWKSIRQLRPTK